MIFVRSLKYDFIARIKCFCYYFSLIVFSNFFVCTFLIHFAKEARVRGVFIIFYLHADEQGMTRSRSHWQSTFPPWPRGKNDCLFGLLTSFEFDFGWIVDRSSPTSVGENLILRSLSWTDRSTIHQKLKSKLGVEFRKTLGSSARPRGQTLFA